MHQLTLLIIAYIYGERYAASLFMFQMCNNFYPYADCYKN